MSKACPKGTVCALCCTAVKPGTASRCVTCTPKYLHAFYCSPKCKKADAVRHKDECIVAAETTNGEELLAKWWKHKGGVSDSASTYNCGCEAGAKGFQVHRVLPQTTAVRPAVKRAAEEDCQPLEDYKRRFVEGCKVCCKPWLDYASSTSLMATWLPPTASGRFALHTYTLEYREVPDPAHASENPHCVQGANVDIAAQQTEAGPWQRCKDRDLNSADPERAGSGPHTGTCPSHWLVGLTLGTWVEVRVKVTGPAPEWADNGEFSEASDAFRVGYADFSPVAVPPEGLPASKFSDAEIKFFMTLDTPAKVQDYLDAIPMNHEVAEETYLSALETLRQNHGHCVEGAMLGAYILSLHGHQPLMMDMNAHEDDSHNIIPFKVKGRWGSLSVSNHASLRYRDPVYKTLRELMLSYFNDYMNGKGQKSLEGYTMPMNLAVVFGPRWATRRGECWEIGDFGDLMKAYPLCSTDLLGELRLADDMMQASTVLQREWRCPDNFDEETARRNANK